MLVDMVPDAQQENAVSPSGPHDAVSSPRDLKFVGSAVRTFLFGRKDATVYEYSHRIPGLLIGSRA